MALWFEHIRNLVAEWYGRCVSSWQFVELWRGRRALEREVFARLESTAECAHLGREALEDLARMWCASYSIAFSVRMDALETATVEDVQAAADEAEALAARAALLVLRGEAAPERPHLYRGRGARL